MSSEVETSRGSTFAPTSRNFSTSLRMPERLFAALDLYHDNLPQSAAMNMAIDDALLESATAPSIRFYRWDHRAISFGYFGHFADVAEHTCDLVRRWTGGGIVFHGDDLTYSIVIPSSDKAFAESPMSIYEEVHYALRDALIAMGEEAIVCRRDALPRVPDVQKHVPPSCFANPVHADVMMNGRKVAGAAQRRTRRGLLQQGSIQYVHPNDGLTERFANQLSLKCSARKIDNKILERAREITAQKYGTEGWLRKR